MRVLVTGGCGFIGSNLNLNHEVATLDCMTYAATKKPDYLVDICDQDEVRKVVKDFRPDAVVHLAAETHVTRSLEDAIPFIRANVYGTISMLKACAGIRFIHVSTDEVYGDAGGTAEDAFLLPTNPYASSKALGDFIARQYNVVVVRPCNNFGPNQHVEKFIPRSIARVRAGDPIELHGDGQHKREWMHVSDFSSAIGILLERGEGVYNVGTGFELTNETVAKTIQRIIGGSIVYVQDRYKNDRQYGMKCDRIRALGWMPKTSFEQGINSLCAM